MPVNSSLMLVFCLRSCTHGDIYIGSALCCALHILACYTLASHRFISLSRRHALAFARTVPLPDKSTFYAEDRVMGPSQVSQEKDLGSASVLKHPELPQLTGNTLVPAISSSIGGRV